jgi:hypothetical protein
MLAALSLVGACVAPEADPACRDPELQDLVGQPVQALYDRFPEGGYKVDWPLPDGTATLEDFPDRVRASVNVEGTILGIGCG